MTDNEIYPEEPQDSIDLLDDVEGHGLKEVAAGLGAAAVLAGGAAGATQLASSATVHPSSSGTTVSVSVDDPVQSANDATDAAIVAAQATRDAAVDRAETAAARTVSAVEGLPSTVKADVATARATATWATDVARAEAHAAASAATQKVDRTVAAADRTADRTTTGAGTAVRDADRKVATILSVVTTTATDGVHTAKVTLASTEAGAGADTRSAGGWVLVKAGDDVLAQVHLDGGTATASWTMPLVGGSSVQISYTGDDTFAASARTVAL